MQDFFYNLQGGINTSRTRVALGVDTKKLYWDDAVNVEILKRQGICRQKGNKLLFQLEEKEAVSGMFEYPKNSESFVFVTESGKIYHYDSVLSSYRVVHTLPEAVSAVYFTYYLEGVVICTDTNGGVFLEIGAAQEVSPLNLKDPCGNEVLATSLCTYASRVWVGSGSTLYFSALGRFDDWSSSEDAGYIEKFHCSTSKIVAIKEYTGCLALYKEDGVWLLGGTTIEDFSISRFADKGTFCQNSVLTANNKQFFINRGGVFALEQAGELSQISLSANIATNVQLFFEHIDYKKTAKTLVLAEDTKNHIWFFVPFSGASHLGRILIFDYDCGAWLKREIPYDITCGASVFGKIYTASASGEVFVENTGNTFAQKPIQFYVSTPFFNLGAPTVRKIIENMNFIFDESRQNRFKFAVSKDYISTERFDVEFVDTVQPDVLVWQEKDVESESQSVWGDGKTGFMWAKPLEEAYKTDIFDSNTSVQLHIQGNEVGDDFAIVGIEFKEVINDE